VRFARAHEAAVDLVPADVVEERVDVARVGGAEVEVMGVLLAVDAVALGPALRHEPSRGGQLFPPLYAVLPLSAVMWCELLPWDAASASHLWPERLRVPAE